MSAPSCIAVPTERFAHSRVAHSPASQSPVSPSPVAVADTHTHSPSRRSNTPKSQVQHRYSEFIQVTKTLQGIGFVLEMVEYACAFRKTIWSSTSNVVFVSTVSLNISKVSRLSMIQIISCTSHIYRLYLPIHSDTIRSEIGNQNR